MRYFPAYFVRNPALCSFRKNCAICTFNACGNASDGLSVGITSRSTTVSSGMFSSVRVPSRAAERETINMRLRRYQSRVDRGTGIFGFELAHLPLAREEPKWIANFRAQTSRKIFRTRARLEPIVSGDLRIAINVGQQTYILREDVVECVERHGDQVLTNLAAAAFTNATLRA